MKELDALQKKKLLTLAREAIETYLNRRIEIPPPTHDFLQEPGCCFVSLHLNGELRGCIGCTQAVYPLGNSVIRCALSAAFADPRFPPLQPHEFAKIDLEISVLSTFHRIKTIEEIEVGRHGILISLGMARGLLLPQVASEWGWDRIAFLEFTCRKAGLHPEAYKDPDARIDIFSADVFSEKEL